MKQMVKVSKSNLLALLQDLLDFIGTEGVVHEDFAFKRDALCNKLRMAQAEVDRLDEVSCMCWDGDTPEEEQES